MYLRVTERRNRDGSTVAYYALAENDWNAEAKRSETRVIHSFGRADQLDRAALQRLLASINRVIDADAADTLPTRGKTAVAEIEIDAVFELGIGEAIRIRADRAGLTAPHEVALFAMAAQRLDDPASKLACATRWLSDIAWLPQADAIAVDQLYRALDFLAVWSDEIERDVFLKAADLLRLDVDLIFDDTTTAYFEIDEPDEFAEHWAGKLYAPLRQRGHSKEGRDNQPQVIIALAVTRDGNAGALVGAARQHRRRRHGGPHQAGPARLAARPLPVRRRCRDVFGRQSGRTQPRPRPLRAGGTDAPGAGR
jgi:hypothetical protein